MEAEVLAGGLLALYPLPPPAGHRSPGEEQVERRGRRARSSWTLARIPQKRLFQDLSTWTQFRELSSRSLARDSLLLLPVVFNGKYQTPFVGSRPLPSITVTQLHPPTAAPHSPRGDLHISMPLNLEGPSFSILKTPTQSERPISVSPSLHRPSSLCPVPPPHAYPCYDLSYRCIIAVYLHG